ncbi:hypothetical protein JKP88DRAFT_261217 [Tribonema minus]|uniref:RING-type domain-containing protein n=1 Tax=Tribonema minus TaxID=303371 RepID=A0A835YXU1_9STRA|nr:hypothetical protein JKP88DRAFT_261217 [Tribonema minus]
MLIERRCFSSHCTNQPLRESLTTPMPPTEMMLSTELSADVCINHRAPPLPRHLCSTCPPHVTHAALKQAPPPSCEPPHASNRSPHAADPHLHCPLVPSHSMNSDDDMDGGAAAVGAAAARYAARPFTQQQQQRHYSPPPPPLRALRSASSMDDDEAFARQLGEEVMDEGMGAVPPRAAAGPVLSSEERAAAAAAAAAATDAARAAEAAAAAADAAAALGYAATGDDDDAAMQRALEDSVMSAIATHGALPAAPDCLACNAQPVAVPLSCGHRACQECADTIPICPVCYKTVERD